MSAVIAERIKTFSDTSPDDELYPRHTNRMMDDAVLNALQVAGLHRMIHYPHIDTEDNTLACVTSADTVTISAAQKFSVAGVLFNTSDLTNLAVTIPDSFDGYLRVKLPTDFGDIVSEAANPIERNLEPEWELTTGSESDAEGTGGGPNSPINMRVYHVTKGSGGETPVIVTAYSSSAFDKLTQDTFGQHIEVFTSSGTFTVPDGVTRVWVEVLGAGGGGGGCTTGGAAGGGAAGGYVAGFMDVTPGEEITVTVGSAGAPGAAGDNDGTGGGGSCFDADYPTRYFSGGGGGYGHKGSVHTGGLGGTATGGDINIPGQPGEYARGDDWSAGGQGGSTKLGKGGWAGTVASLPGGPATGYGSGGGGACGSNPGDAGGVGAPGLVIVKY